MAYITEAEFREQLAAALQRADLEVDSFWETIIPKAYLFGQNEIRAAVVAQGYTAADADAWDRAEEFSLHLGLWWALVQGGVTQAYDATYLQFLDRREELKTATILVNGEEPDDGLGDPVSTGMLENENDTDWLNADF